MEELQKFMQRNSRRISALLILFAAFITISMLMGSGPTGSAWIASRTIATGSKISVADISRVKVNLTTDSSHYLQGGDSIIGEYTTSPIFTGDLISVNQVSRIPINLTLQYLPVGIAVNDLPSDLQLSDLVDIYVIPKDQGSLPTLIVHRISVQSIDIKSRSLGGTVAISLAANSAQATLIVDAESQGRLVVARDPF
jgi:hypothetical protein